MVTRAEAFPSRFVNAATVPEDRPIVATILFAKMEDLDNGTGKPERKLIVYFSDLRQSLALNRANFDAIAGIVGSDDTDLWPDTKIELYRTTTDLRGRQTPCVRVQAPTRPAAAPARKYPADRITSGLRKNNMPEPPPYDSIPDRGDDDF